ncbi:6491_t:CDS:2 [Rhizophagus irregularis]|nr:6491_t:CDS:2 [Rhizophagus irregularis]
MITFIICPEEIALNSGQAQPEEFGEDIILDSQRNKSKESGEAWLGVLMDTLPFTSIPNRDKVEPSSTSILSTSAFSIVIVSQSSLERFFTLLFTYRVNFLIKFDVLSSKNIVISTFRQLK